MSVTILKKDIAASLFIKPATLKELLKRDFLKNKSAYGIEILLQQMETDKQIYFKGDKYSTYKKYAQSDKMKEYDLDV